MNNRRLPFPTGWWGTDLGDYRPCSTTYCLYPYESLPPLPLADFRNDFRWLAAQRSEDDLMPEGSGLPSSGETPGFRIDAPRGLRLPDDFLAFFGMPQLRRHIRSCTDCSFNLPEWIIPWPGKGGGYLIQFLQDSQDCLFWYLYLKKITHSWESCVVASGSSFNPYHLEDDDETGDIVYCAPGFEPFLYRFWIENEIWFALDEGKPLSEAQRAYVGHYRAIPKEDQPD